MWQVGHKRSTIGRYNGRASARDALSDGQIIMLADCAWSQQGRNICINAWLVRIDIASSIHLTYHTVSNLLFYE